jgi:bifunctional DNase/RNase
MSDRAPVPNESDVAVEPVDEGVAEPVVIFKVMTVESVMYDLSDPSPLVHLTEAESPYRYITIPIALPEAVALHNAVSNIDGRRPGTHELVASVLRRLQCDVIAARIVRCEQGVFYAELDLMTPKGREVFDCRTSDALIFAARQVPPAPVLCAEAVLEALYS